MGELLESKETERLEKIKKLEKILNETIEAGEEASKARMSEKAVSQKKIEQLEMNLDGVFGERKTVEEGSRGVQKDERVEVHGRRDIEPGYQNPPSSKS